MLHAYVAQSGWANLASRSSRQILFREKWLGLPMRDFGGEISVVSEKDDAQRWPLRSDKQQPIQGTEQSFMELVAGRTASCSSFWTR